MALEYNPVTERQPEEPRTSNPEVLAARYKASLRQSQGIPANSTELAL